MKLKGIGQGRHRTNAELEPNFYRMKPVGPGDSIDADLGIANALAASRLQQQQQQMGASHTAAMAANALNNATSLNALHLFGNNAPAATTSTMGSTAGMGSGANFDLNNLFFLTNGGDLNQASQISAVLIPQNQQERNFQAAQQGSANSSAYLLANLFNANANNSSHENCTQHAAFDMSSGSFQYHHANDPAGNLQDIDLSNLRNLLQNSEANPLAAQTLMQYMADSSSDTSSQANAAPPSAPTISGSQVSWPTHGAPPRTYQSQQVDHTDHSMNAPTSALQSTNVGHGLTGTEDFASSLGLDGSSFRRMSSANSAATRYSSNLGTSPHISCLEAPNNTTSRFFSSPQGRHSESAKDLLQLLESNGASTDAPGFKATQTTDRMTSASSGLYNSASRGIYQSRQLPATQQYSFLNTAGGGGGPGSSISELLGGSRMPQAASNPTFLDSVYEPIPIKDGTGGAGGQQKAADRTSPGGSVNSHSHSLTGRPSSPVYR